MFFINLSSQPLQIKLPEYMNIDIYNQNKLPENHLIEVKANGWLIAGNFRLD